MATLVAAQPIVRARDPVCGMVLDTSPDAAPVLQETWHGQIFAFCSEACRQEFRAAPVHFLPPLLFHRKRVLQQFRRRLCVCCIW